MKDKEGDVNTLMNIIDKVMSKSKYKCFGKVSYKRSRKEEKIIESLQKEKLSANSDDSNYDEIVSDIDVKLANALHDLNGKLFDDELKSLTELKTKKGKAAAVFNLKDKVLGPKKQGLETIVIKDPDTGVPIHSHDEIKAASLIYCKKLLTNRAPRDGYEETYENKIKLHNMRMIEATTGDCEYLEYDQFKSAIRQCI